MNLSKKTAEFLNSGQISIIACDCPIFALCERYSGKGQYIQGKWPEDFSENNFIVMLGGLHIKKALWICLRNLVASSGWTAALADFLPNQVRQTHFKKLLM